MGVNVVLNSGRERATTVWDADSGSKVQWLVFGKDYKAEL